MRWYLKKFLQSFGMVMFAFLVVALGVGGAVVLFAGICERSLGVAICGAVAILLCFALIAALLAAIDP